MLVKVGVADTNLAEVPLVFEVVVEIALDG